MRHGLKKITPTMNADERNFDKINAMSRSLPVLVAATFPEANFILEGLGSHPSKQWEIRPSYAICEYDEFRMVVTGIGLNRAKEGLSDALREFPNASPVIGLGLCGGLIRTAAKGDLLISESIQEEGDARIYLSTPKLLESLQKLANKKSFTKLLSTQHMVSSEVEKAALYAATNCEVVDMEAAAWAKAAMENGRSWCVIRSVLDTTQDHLSQDWSEFVDDFGHLEWKRFVPKFLFSPQLWLEALNLRPSKLKMLLKDQIELLNLWLTEQSKTERTHTKQSTVESKNGQFSFLNPTQ